MVPFINIYLPMICKPFFYPGGDVVFCVNRIFFCNSVLKLTSFYKFRDSPCTKKSAISRKVSVTTQKTVKKYARKILPAVSCHSLKSFKLFHKLYYWLINIFCGLWCRECGYNSFKWATRIHISYCHLQLATHTWQSWCCEYWIMRCFISMDLKQFTNIEWNFIPFARSSLWFIKLYYYLGIQCLTSKVSNSWVRLDCKNMIFLKFFLHQFQNDKG